MRDRRLAAAVGLVAAIAVLAAGGVVLTAATDRREVAFTRGLPAVRVASVLRPGDEACRRRIDVPAAFGAIRLVVGTYGAPGSALDVRVLDEPSGRVVGRGGIPAGYPDNSTIEARVGDVQAGSRVRVCVVNAGEAPVALFGAPTAAAGRLIETHRRAELGLVFARAQPRPVLSDAGEMAARAARFKARWLEPWMLWALVGGLALAVPAMLGAALRASYASERSSGRSEESSSDASSKAS